MLPIGAAIGLAGYLIAGLAGFTSPGPTVLAACLGGVVLSRDPGLKARPMALAAACGLGVLALVLGLAAVAEIPLRHAIIAVARGDNAAAARDFSAARALRFWDVDLPDLAAHAFATQGLSDGDPAAIAAAGEWLDRVPAELRQDEQVELDAASYAEGMGRYADAIAGLTHVLTVDRYNPAVMLQRGVTEAEASQLDAAERDFLAASSIVPNEPGPWTNLAAIYQEEGRSSEAGAAKARADSMSEQR